MHYVAPQGLILHLLTFYAYILFLSAAFRYRATRHGYINHSSSLLLSWCVTLFLCCAWERTLIEHKVLIKTNTEPNQSDIWPVLLFMWQHLLCLFIKSLICSTWTLLVFLFLLLSREKSLTVSQAFRHGSSQFLKQMVFLKSVTISPVYFPHGLRLVNPSCYFFTFGTTWFLLEQQQTHIS